MNNGRTTRHQRQRPYIALADYNFDWTPTYVERVIRWYTAGYPLTEISQRLRRHQIEVACLLMDLADRELIEPRPGGIWGGQEKKERKWHAART